MELLYVQSSSQITTSNIQRLGYYRPDALPAAQQKCQNTGLSKIRVDTPENVLL